MLTSGSSRARQNALFSRDVLLLCHLDIARKATDVDFWRKKDLGWVRLAGSLRRETASSTSFPVPAKMSLSTGSKLTSLPKADPLRFIDLKERGGHHMIEKYAFGSMTVLGRPPS
jgi:hypothetical protein